MLSSSDIFVASARTALKIAFKNLDVKTGLKVLVPETICDVLLHPILSTGLIPEYYPVNKTLTPDWEALESIVVSMECHSLIMVHYFGQPQDIERYTSFCSRHNLLLIEDNAHGYGGCFNGRPLGLFGDIGISSPRKFISVPSGGVLHGVDNKSFEIIQGLKPFPILRPKVIFKIILNFYRPCKSFFRGWFDRRKDWSDPFIYHEIEQPDYGIDQLSRCCIESTDWLSVAESRRKSWVAWERFARKNGLRTVFSAVYPESCPWAIPVYTRDIEERNLWLAWGAKNKIGLFPWPSLPSDIISKNGNALERWETMFCFPLDMKPIEINKISSL